MPDDNPFVDYDENPEGWRCLDTDVRGERSAFVFATLIGIAVGLVFWFAR